MQRTRNRLPATLIAILALLLAGDLAFGDDCANCERPTLEELEKEAEGFVLETRPAGFGQVQKDHYLLDKGECVSAPDGPPEVRRLGGVLVLRGQGEVWNCPHSKSVDKITVQREKSDSTSWSFTAMVSLKLKSLAAEFKAQVEAGKTKGETIVEITSISKTITPSYCHRIQWKAFFDVSTYEAKGKISAKQRWAWWTKNRYGGVATVFAKGDYWKVCKSGEFTMQRMAPISGYFQLSQKGCADPSCKTVVTQQLGFFPELPPGLKLPDDDPLPVPPAPSGDDGETGPDQDAPADEGTGDAPSGG